MVRGSNPAIQYMAAWMATVSLVFERRSAGFWERNGTNELGIPLLTLELLPGCNFRQHAPVPMAIRSAVKKETRDMGSSENRVPDFSLVV